MTRERDKWTASKFLLSVRWNICKSFIYGRGFFQIISSRFSKFLNIRIRKFLRFGEFFFFLNNFYCFKKRVIYYLHSKNTNIIIKVFFLNFIAFLFYAFHKECIFHCQAALEFMGFFWETHSILFFWILNTFRIVNS